ncbi:hypothetical protein ACIQPP_05530 [Streptomyces violaceusniger]|uniref:hypothetical protein n=1 Tax=Streptomyces violaceusniger TaxID=68280 RepID=UPI0009C2E278|nr:hypothetical protein [Streptomyces hygroscopicus]AQW55282.1 hypothetical protein SHXM_08745 [Streptomyces hygroscopicus]
MSAEDLHDAATSQQWIVGVFHVLTLDELWTQTLRSEHLDLREMDEAANIGETLRDAWLRLTEPDTLSEQRRYVVEGEHPNEPRMGSSPGEKWLRALGGPKEAADSAFRSLDAARDDEAEHLAAKIESLRRRTWTSGDLSPRSSCRLLVAAAGIAWLRGWVDLANMLLAWAVAQNCPMITAPPG